MGYGQGTGVIAARPATRSVVLASADAEFRGRLRRELAAMRWEVREAGGGAEAIAQLESAGAEALLVDSWLPDLDVREFAGQMRSWHPEMELLQVDGGLDEGAAKSPRRNELLHALRYAQEQGSSAGTDGAAWASAPVAVPRGSNLAKFAPWDERAAAAEEVAAMLRARSVGRSVGGKADPFIAELERVVQVGAEVRGSTMALPDMIGESVEMRELARLVRLVAPRSTSVLIQGETGTGKELVAKAVHRLSARASKPYLVLNCAAIPESLLEAELFGHTRGAFTGAVQSRTGRVEAANGGTLFLDEIGEMPLALQAKMLRFLESGEIQRVGGNETVRVDVRIVSATHQPLEQRMAEKAFRLDLYHRLAVFPMRVPPLRERMEDVLPLAGFLLERLGEEMPVKRLSAGARRRLMEHGWAGNVRELAHVLERATILAEGRAEIAETEIRF